MRIVLVLFFCCLTGCSSFKTLDMDLSAPEGRVELTSFAVEGESFQVTRSNSLSPNSVGHFDLAIGEYYGLGVNEDNDTTLHGGLTYRPQTNFSFFAGVSLNIDNDSSTGIEYGAQYLMNHFSVELRRDEENDLTLLGLGREF